MQIGFYGAHDWNDDRLRLYRLLDVYGSLHVPELLDASTAKAAASSRPSTISIREAVRRFSCRDDSSCTSRDRQRQPQELASQPQPEPTLSTT